MKIRTKLFLALFVILFLFTGFFSYIVYLDNVTTKLEELRQELISFSKASALLIDAKDLSQLHTKEDINLPTYKKVENTLAKIKASNPKIQEVYLMRKTEKSNTYAFIIDLGTDENKDGILDEKERALPGEEYDISESPEMQKAFDNPTADKEFTRDKWGVWLSGYAPIYDENGTAIAILGVDVNANTILQERHKLQMRLFSLALLAIGISFGIAYIGARTLTNSIKKLVEASRRISKGIFNIPVVITSKDELFFLAEAFNLMQSQIERMLLEIGEKKAIEKELEIASKIQHSLLPSPFLQFENMHVAAKNSFASEMGGDYFDFFHSSNRLSGVVADVSGHSISAALVMVMIKTLFKAGVGNFPSTAKTLTLLNKFLTTSKIEKYATMFYYYIDKQTKKMVYTNAGHPAALLFREQSITELVSNDIPIGIDDKVYTNEESIDIKTGDIIVLYTDGITEARNKEGEEFGIERLKEIIAQNIAEHPTPISKKILEEVRTFSQRDIPLDDQTVVVIKIK